MSEIDFLNEAHYTPTELLDLMFQVKNKYVDFQISEYLEPSAGDGRIVERFDKKYRAYDINPKSDKITKADFLSTNIEYVKGRVTMMNPPFSLTNEFLEKALSVSDYVIGVLPRYTLTEVINYDTTQIDYVSLLRDYDFKTTEVTVFVVGCKRKEKVKPNQLFDYKKEWENWLKANSSKPVEIFQTPPFSPEIVDILK